MKKNILLGLFVLFSSVLFPYCAGDSSNKKDNGVKELLQKLQNEDENFDFAVKLYRMNPVPDYKEVYVSTLKKSLYRNDVKTIPYMLGCLRKLKYFPQDENLVNTLYQIKPFDIRIEVIKTLPYYIKKESSLDKYLKFFADKNKNIVRQAAVSLSEISELFLLPRVTEFLKSQINNTNNDETIRNELLLSYIKVSKPSFTDIYVMFGTMINTKGFIQAAQQIADEESKQYLFKSASDSDYHIRLFAVTALDELNKDSSLTGRINEIKKNDTLLQSLLDETGKPRANFDSLKAFTNKYTSAEIKTTRGSIKIKFLPEDAPVSVGNFCKLAVEKYFDGNLFHRVVPGFVIQTGDTTNTGWGGPGYSINTEISAGSFMKGTVGMASSGENTEGSQWFITTGNYPHLDGRYTIFATVISGMDVAEKVTQEDKIISVRLIK